MNTVELRQAWEWTCDECGRDNFARAITAELSKEELEEVKVKMGIFDMNPGDLVTQPTEVICRFCGTIFTVEIVDE